MPNSPVISPECWFMMLKVSPFPTRISRILQYVPNVSIRIGYWITRTLQCVHFPSTSCTGCHCALVCAFFTTRQDSTEHIRRCCYSYRVFLSSISIGIFSLLFSIPHTPPSSISVVQRGGFRSALKRCIKTRSGSLASFQIFKGNKTQKQNTILPFYLLTLYSDQSPRQRQEKLPHPQNYTKIKYEI
jgi:hypothetical protein